MKSSFKLSLVVLLVLTFHVVCPAQSKAAPEIEVPISDKKFQKVENPIPNSYIVVLKEKDVFVESLNNSEQITAFAESLAAHHNAKIALVYASALKGFSAVMDEAAAIALSKDARVEYVVEDAEVKLDATQFNPPSWGIDRIDQQFRPYTGTYNYTATAGGVRAYVIDSGIQWWHPEFGGRASVAADFTGGNGTDCNGHGTHVAGTIAGANTGVGKAASVIGVRVFGCSGGSQISTIVGAVDWVRANAVRPAVVNMSLGAYDPNGHFWMLDNAVRNVVNSGISVIVSAGNDNSQAHNYTPARVQEAFTVGATDYNDNRAWFSNYGGAVDIFAPGVDINSAWLNNGYNTISGTSMAAPHVAGAAAKFLNVVGADAYTVRDIMVFHSTKNIIGNVGAGSPNHLLFSGVYNSCGVLYPGQALYKGWKVTACNGAATLAMQNDGNVVLYKNHGVNAGRALWHTHTFNRPDAGYLPMQTDGNLVLYGNGAVWNSGTWNNPGAYLRVQDDSNMVIYRANNQPIWSTGTNGR